VPLKNKQIDPAIVVVIDDATPHPTTSDDVALAVDASVKHTGCVRPACFATSVSVPETAAPEGFPRGCGFTLRDEIPWPKAEAPIITPPAAVAMVCDHLRRVIILGRVMHWFDRFQCLPGLDVLEFLDDSGRPLDLDQLRRGISAQCLPVVSCRWLKDKPTAVLTVKILSQSGRGNHFHSASIPSRFDFLPMVSILIQFSPIAAVVAKHVRFLACIADYDVDVAVVINIAEAAPRPAHGI